MEENRFAAVPVKRKVLLNPIANCRNDTIATTDIRAQQNYSVKFNYPQFSSSLIEAILNFQCDKY